MPQYIDLSSEEKNELLFRASAATKISPILLEKDYWVSSLLNLIFQMDESKNMIFKGGKSLSKCYGLIQRFSEDIDFTIDKTIFAAGAIIYQERNLKN
ncbi:MAG: nucleotidyl transferase AbiEii/AbiGii toxin family protein [Alphaproteobacteria bacterium]